jgi:hypothetical protein
MIDSGSSNSRSSTTNVAVAQGADQEVRFAGSQRVEQVLIRPLDDRDRMRRSFAHEVDDGPRDEEAPRKRHRPDHSTSRLAAAQRSDFRPGLVDFSKCEARASREPLSFARRRHAEAGLLE